MNGVIESHITNINENGNLKIIHLYENNIKKSNYSPLKHFSYSVKNINNISPNKINNNYSYNIHNNIFFSPQRVQTSISNKNYSILNYYYSCNKSNKKFLNNIQNVSTVIKDRTKEYKIRSMDSFFEKYSKKVKDIQNIINLNKIYCKQTPKLEKYKNNIKNRHLSITNIKDINQNLNITNKDNLESSNHNYISNTTIHKNSTSPDINNRKILNIHAVENNKTNKKNLFRNLSNINNLVDYNSIYLNEINNNNNNGNINFYYNNLNIYSQNNSLSNSNNEITLSYNDFSNKICELIENKKSFFVFMYGSLDFKGKSWCTDCIRSDPLIKKGKEIFLNHKSEKKILWINIPIDKNKKYAYKYNYYLKMYFIPTLIYFEDGYEIGRIVQEQLFSQEIINNFINNAYN